MDRKRLAPKGSDTLRLEVTDDGARGPRPLGRLPLERYSRVRIREFEDTTAVDEKTRAAVRRRLAGA